MIDQKKGFKEEEEGVGANLYKIAFYSAQDSGFSHCH
jgi:hypothetical protein